MRIVTASIAALGFAGAMVLGTPSISSAQGIYFAGPGVEFGVGAPYYREHYYGYDRPYAYRSYGYVRPYPRRHWDWD